VPAISGGLERAIVMTTPSFVINGRLIPGGPPLERFKQILKEKLEKVRARSGWMAGKEIGLVFSTARWNQQIF